MYLHQIDRSTFSQKPATSVAVDIHEHPVTGSSEIPVLQPARQASQLTATQSVTCTSDDPGLPLQLPVLPLSIQTGSGQQSNLTSPVHPEEEGKVSDQEAGISDQNSDQHADHISEE